MNIDIIKESEGFRARPYPCPAGIPTIGYGSTIYPNGVKVTPKDPPITEQRAEELVMYHIEKRCMPIINKFLKRKLNINELSALVSFVYNTGGGYNTKSGWVPYRIFDLINRQSPELADYWKDCAVTGGGKKLSGLVARREKEVDLYFKKV